MIRLLYDTTIGGVRFGQGALIELDATLEDGLIAEGDATRAINFSSSWRASAADRAIVRAGNTQFK